MVRRRIVLSMAVMAIVAAACSGGVGGPAVTSGPGSTDDLGAGLPTLPGGGGGTGGQPSGAKVRVFNAYTADGSGTGAIDVYGDSLVGSDSTPIATVPYGTLSEFFDPGVFDSDGNAFLTFLPAGVKDQDKVLMTQTETLHSSDVLTVYLGTGSQRADGTRGAFDQVYFHHPTGGGVANTPPPGKGLLIVTSAGLDEIMTSQADKTWYVGLGNGCDGGLGSGPGITTTVSPGATGAEYELTPGAVTVGIYAGPSDQIGTCTGEPIAQAQVEAKANVLDVFILYAPKDGQLKSMMIPLEP